MKTVVNVPPSERLGRAGPAWQEEGPRTQLVGRAALVMLALVAALSGGACKVSSGEEAGDRGADRDAASSRSADLSQVELGRKADGGLSRSVFGNMADSPDAGAAAEDAAKAGTVKAGTGPTDPMDAAVETDAGLDDRGGTSHAPPADAAVLDGSIGIGSGSCCATRTTPGCSNGDIQVCVCERLSGCCTDSWSTACTLIVEHKYCQPGIRECVCGTAEGQWGQTACCETAWTDFCDEVAETKCSAIPGCL